MNSRSSAASLLADPRARIDGAQRRRLARSRRSPRSPADPRVTLLTRTTAFGYFPHNLDRPQRASDRSSARVRIPGRRVNACGRCARARWCWPPARSNARWCFRATIGRESCWRAPRRPTSTATVCARDRARSSSPRPTTPIRRRSICTPPASQIAAIADVRAARARRPAGCRAPRRHRTSSRARPCLVRRAICRVSAIALGRADGRGRVQRRNPVLRYRADVRRLHAERASVFAIARQAAVERRGCRPFVPGSSAEREHSPGPAAASTAWPRCWRMARPAGAAALRKPATRSWRAASP